ncbi:hypothetical protein [Corynebacterium tapiri]|uniref:hypothetical protein n=1 Tax=Corynebacterium tapiri TaxID=1448266 RepID=UPI0015D5E609|nr:hypothetical protein [Corynebacterium tapiri]
MSRPIPRDPNAPQVDPEQLRADVTEVLTQQSGSLQEEADILERAHDLLAHALKLD